MAFIPIPNTARVELRFTQDSQQCANVFHVESSAPLSVGDLTSMGDAFATWYADLATNVSATVTLREISIVDQSSASSIGIIYNSGLPITGSVSGEAMPNGTSIAIKWSTGLTGRSFRGRTFHLGLAINQADSNEINSTLATLLVARYQELVTEVAGADFTLVVASRYANNAPRVTGVTTPILTASLADLTLDRQWRRMPGRGR